MPVLAATSDRAVFPRVFANSRANSDIMTLPAQLITIDLGDDTLVTGDNGV